MKPLILLFISLFFISCKSEYSNITGAWELSFDDSDENRMQILNFTDNYRLSLLIDVPLEDMFGIPGEKLFFKNDSLYFETYWGLYKYTGKIFSGDSVIKGYRTTNDQNREFFTLKKAEKNLLSYKIPRANRFGQRIIGYQYRKPQEKGDGILCGEMTETGIDTTIINDLIGNILKGNIQTIHSLLIAKNNNLVLEEYFHNYSSERIHSVESVTKSFTSALMGIGIDRGFVESINNLVWPYFADRDTTLLVKNRYGIQIKHLLTMSSGLDWKGLTPNESNDDMDIYKSTDYIAYILNKKLKDQPGGNFYYNNRLMYLQGGVLEKATKQTINIFAKKYLFNELDITNYSWEVYDNGVTETGGGLRMLPRDMMKFGLLYLNKGKWQNKQIISEDWISSSIKQQIGAGSQGYGFNWWIKDYNVGNQIIKTFYALGHGEQVIMVVPRFSLVFIMTAGNYFEAKQWLDEIMVKYILPSVIDSGDQMEIVSLEKFTGRYKIDEIDYIDVELMDGELVATDLSGKKLKLEYVSVNVFSIKNSPRTVHFVSDERNSISSAEVYINGEKVEEFKKI